MEVNLIGMRAEEAVTALDKFIDDALLAGYNKVDVIHGRGTGALRKATAEYLEAHPRVAGFSTPGLDRGGTGVTMVELKN